MTHTKAQSSRSKGDCPAGREGEKGDLSAEDADDRRGWEREGCHTGREGR